MISPFSLFSLRFLAALSLAASPLAELSVAQDDGPNFNREVRPILSAHCFACHGPDPAERKADFRLDQPSDTDRSRIVPENGELSPLLERLVHPDPEERMPPPAAKNPLTDSQIKILREWVKQGAPYEPHWSFLPPIAVSPPKASGPFPGPLHPIDAFVQRRLEEHDLSLSDQADRHTLVRRLFLDLLGFPPTPEETDAYIDDRHPEAENRLVDRLVDRLLASPAYGERWASRWLDLARYADTNGYEKDRRRSIWPYRGWVLQALNADMPFDQFTVEQLAGDLLPEASLAQRIATGFHRNTMLNEEGGIDPLEYRFHSLVDRVNTTSTIWLGLTMACAQCHTHKYDPLDHRDYYAMMAFLNNADEPELEIPDARIEGRRRALQEKIARRERELPKHFPADRSFDDALTEWFEDLAGGLAEWTFPEISESSANLSKLQALEDGSLLARGDQTKRDVYHLRLAGRWEGVRAVRLEALPHPSLPAHGPGRAYYEGLKGDFFLSEIQLLQDGQRVPFHRATENHAKLGIGGGKASASEAIDGNEVTGWSTSGREGEPHQAVFLLEAPLTSPQPVEIRLISNRHYPATLGRFRLAFSRTSDPEPRAQVMSVSEEMLFRRPWESLSPDERQRVAQLFCEQSPLLAKAREAIAQLRNQLPEHPSTLVFRERPADHPRQTFRHHRGEFLQPRESVAPGLPGLFSDLKGQPPADRLGFARWLVSRENPLAARVRVNRDWSAFFGHGLVRTTEDFGSQGSPPSYPLLLDWLAVDFMDHGWSRKRLHRSMLSSATYRQSSHLDGERLKRDPENRLLSRGSRFRIEAELVKDTALRVAGLLTAKTGGPSVFPPQPPNVTTEGTYGRLQWKVSEDEDRYRRGLYTFSKRTAPYAMFTTFDAGSGEACLARREITNTPLQALTALNDTVFFEAAQTLGRQMVRSPLPDREKVERLFRRALTRPPDAEETNWMLAFLKQQAANLEARPQTARKLTNSESDSSQTVAQAQWTLLARALLNLDETFLHH